MSGIVRSQHSVNGVRPRILGSRYTMPQRETVAGDATAKSCTSNIIVITWGSKNCHKNTENYYYSYTKEVQHWELLAEILILQRVWWSLRSLDTVSCCHPEPCSCSQSTQHPQVHQTCTTSSPGPWRQLHPEWDKTVYHLSCNLTVTVNNLQYFFFFKIFKGASDTNFPLVLFFRVFM